MGYLGGWALDRLTGNTLWDWLHLLLLPLLLPTVVVPSLRPLFTAGVIFLEAEDVEDHSVPRRRMSVSRVASMSRM